MIEKKQIVFILSLAISLGLLRSFFLDDPKFTLIKKERIIEEVSSFLVPDDMTGAMLVNLEFAKYHFDASSAIFIDARDPEEYESGHIQNAINIPYDYYEDYEDVINGLDDTAPHVIYCSGEECSLSMDLADYLFNELAFENILIFEGGWPQWRDADLPSSLNISVIIDSHPTKTIIDLDDYDSDKNISKITEEKEDNDENNFKKKEKYKIKIEK